MKVKTTEEIVERLAAMMEDITRYCHGLGSLSEIADPRAICKVLGVIGEFREEAAELRKEANILSVNKSING